MFNPTFNYYASDIKKSSPLGSVSMIRMLHGIANPNDRMKDILEKITYYSKIKDEENRSHYKKMLYSFTPAVRVEGRRCYSDIVEFTGLAPMDFDKFKSEDEAMEFKHDFFHGFTSVIACWLSSSKLGVRALVRIPVVFKIDDYKAHYHALLKDFEEYKNMDSAPKNCVLPLFLSYDPDILYSEEVDIYDKKYFEPSHPKVPQYRISNPDSKVEKIISSAMNKIMDNGHPQLRAISYALGGYVGQGYISESEAKNLIERLIESNQYLSSGIRSKPYVKTAHQFIEKGKNEPLTIEQ
jgi:hypothetical protein